MLEDCANINGNYFPLVANPNSDIEDSVSTGGMGTNNSSTNNIQTERNHHEF